MDSTITCRFSSSLLHGAAMGYDDQTDIGGEQHRFLTTHWSLIGDIQASTTRDSALIGLLLERYWKPVYCYLRRKGYDNEQAKDLTQGFFHDVVLNHRLVERADQGKGRFRAFLLHALNQYLINETQRSNARRCIPRDKLVSLEVVDPSRLPQTVQEADPEAAYHYAWMSALLDQTLETVRRDCSDHGLDVHWQLFLERVVDPILGKVSAPPLSVLCEKHRIDDPQKASNMIATVKRRFQSAVREHIRPTVLEEDHLDDELAEIMQFLPKTAQDSR
jgi:DNA-directed RNA polymerase specialized sigma24 family protein